jgi:molybdenum cofactor synthesis domain-containing protein
MSDKKKKARAGRPRTAAAIIIGNEILSGKIADQNLVVLARVLRKLGVQLVRTVVIPDVLETIVEEVRAAAKAHTWVFTSGGVGPTHDDLTIVGVAKAFKKKVETSAELEAKIRAAYGDRLREGHLFMARVPKGAKLVQTEEVPWPAVVMKNVWVLPGVPEVFAHKMVLLEQLIEPAEAFESVAVFSTLDEGNLKPTSTASSRSTRASMSAPIRGGQILTCARSSPSTHATRPPARPPRGPSPRACRRRRSSRARGQPRPQPDRVSSR